jgi:hypothetical protein
MNKCSVNFCSFRFAFYSLEIISLIIIFIAPHEFGILVRLIMEVDQHKDLTIWTHTSYWHGVEEIGFSEGPKRQLQYVVD